MALRTPPSWLQNGSHPAENDRLTAQALIATTGIIKSTSLAVTQAASPGMAVQVAEGWGAIVGNFTTNMGVYQVYNDAATQLTITTANPSNPRIDRIVVTVNDAFYTGATNNVIFQVLAGTPAGSPTAPATPVNSLSLATVAVAASAATITNANITDTRVSITTNLPVGDLTEVAAGTGISVASGTGPIPTVTNTMATAITTNGDLIYGTGSGTFVRRGIGTTGQFLGVAGGVPTWTDPGDITGVAAGVGISGGGTSGDVTVTNTMATAITTNGDLIYGTGAGTFVRRGIGSNGQVLSVSGGVPTWATASAGSWTLAAQAALSGASVTVSSLSGKQYYIYLEGWSSDAAASVSLRFNNDTGANYRTGATSDAENQIRMNGLADQSAAARLSNGAFVNMADTAMSRKPIQNVNGLLNANGSTGGWYVSTSAITSVTMFPNNGSWDAGNYYIWSFA